MNRWPSAGSAPGWPVRPTGILDRAGSDRPWVPSSSDFPDQMLTGDVDRSARRPAGCFRGRCSFSDRPTAGPDASRTRPAPWRRLARCRGPEPPGTAGPAVTYVGPWRSSRPDDVRRSVNSLAPIGLCNRPGGALGIPKQVVAEQAREAAAVQEYRRLVAPDAALAQGR